MTVRVLTEEEKESLRAEMKASIEWMNNELMKEKKVEDRIWKREQIRASFRLEGIEFTNEEEAMFQIFDDKGWDADTCIKFYFEFKGYSPKK